MRNLGNLGNLERTLGTLGTFTWEPLLGNLGGIGFGAAPVCSETFTMAEDPNASAVGEIPMFFALQKPKTTVFTRFFASRYLHCFLVPVPSKDAGIYAYLRSFNHVPRCSFQRFPVESEASPE